MPPGLRRRLVRDDRRRTVLGEPQQRLPLGLISGQVPAQLRTDPGRGTGAVVGGVRRQPLGRILVALLRFEAAVTAIRVSGLSWSFAYASRCAALHVVCSVGRERHSRERYSVSFGVYYFGSVPVWDERRGRFCQECQCCPA
jgi:hypothetical protein